MRWSRECAGALAGVVGPTGFVAAWAVLGSIAPRYSPAHDAISELASVDAPTRGFMTAGFLVFGVGVLLYAPALRHQLPGWAWASASATALAAVAVAAFPLDASPSGDMAHGVFAVLGYATLQRPRGWRPARWVSEANGRGREPPG